MIGAACLVLGFLFPAAAKRGRRGNIVQLRIAALALLLGSAKAVGVSPGLDDAGAVGNAIDQRLAEPRIGNHLRPFRERQVGSNSNRQSFRTSCFNEEQGGRARKFAEESAIRRRIERSRHAAGA
jgi:hypothetical protein